MNIIDIARCFKGVREAGENKGLRVEAIQHYSGGQEGDSWCAEMVWMWMDLSSNQNPIFDRVQSCEVIHQWGIKNNRTSNEPNPGNLVLSINPNTNLAHHVGLITSINPLMSIAGNTSEDGISSNGDGVYEHIISPENKVYISIEK